MAHIKACQKAKSDKAKERKKLKGEKAAAAAGKDQSSITDTNGDVNGDGDEKKKGAKKMMKKDGDGTKSKKRKADGKLRTQRSRDTFRRTDSIQNQSSPRNPRPRRRKKSLRNPIQNPKVALLAHFIKFLTNIPSPG